MDSPHIRPGRKFRHCHPLDNTVLIVRSHDGGERVLVTDVDGKRPRTILATRLRPSAARPDGRPYKSGYAPAD